MTAHDRRAAQIAQAKARAAARGQPRRTVAPGAKRLPATPRTAAHPAPPIEATSPASEHTAPWRTVAHSGGGVLTARPDGRAAERQARTPAEARRMTRRAFVGSAFWSGLGVVGAGLLLGFVNFFWPRGVQGFGGIISVPAAQVPEPGGEPIRNIEGKFWLVNLEPGGGVPSAFQSFAPPSAEGGLLAIYQKCPHLGCTVPWRPEFVYEGERGWFRCPCHGSTYTKAGIRVFGPAPRPMDLFPLTVSGDGSVSVNTDPAGIISGSAQNANRAVLA